MKQGKKNKLRILSLISFLVILALWCAVTYSGMMSEIFLPTPTAVFKSIIEMYKDGTLFVNASVSFIRVFNGWAIAAVISVPIGIVMATSNKINAILQPVMEFARYLPIAALVPLTLIYCGIGEGQKYTVIFLGTFFQLVLMILDGVSSVDKNLLNAARTLGAKRWQRYFLVIFPAALPSILDSFRMTIGWAWTYLVVAEIVAADTGLGYMILKAQRYLATDRIFAGLILIGLIGLATDWVFRMLSKLIVPWYDRLSE